jgi:hypothetical protein
MPAGQPLRKLSGGDKGTNGGRVAIRLARRPLPYHGAVLRVSTVIAVAALAAIAAGCGSSHSTAPPTTSSIPTIPKKTLQLAVKDFPNQLAGSIVFNIDRTHGDPRKPGGWRRQYTVKLTHLVLRRIWVRGKGDQRKARYDLVSAKEAFTGFEDLTNSKCKTTRIVWAGSGKPATGDVEIFGPKFDASVGFVFLVPQRGATTTRPCRSGGAGARNTVTRTARIAGNANLKLVASKVPSNRFAIGIEIQSSTAGTGETGGYTINGILAPPATGSPVQVCKEQGTKLTCPA